MAEYEIEPIPGLPEPLPPGEHILWQGAPGWWALARGAFHLRALAWYFLALIAWAGISALLSRDAVQSTAILLPALGLVAGALVGGLAWMAARSTRYTITNRRVVLRIGMAFPITLNLPFNAIQSAELRREADGSGDIFLRLLPGPQKIGWYLLWPHARPWQLSRPQPALRALTEVTAPAQVLARALAGAASLPVVPLDAGAAQSAASPASAVVA
jgi:hypothetical protein